MLDAKSGVCGDEVKTVEAACDGGAGDDDDDDDEKALASISRPKADAPNVLQRLGKISCPEEVIDFC